MQSHPLTREHVASQLGVSTATLLRYEAHGLVRPAGEGAARGYGPAEIRRAWTVVTFHRDLGINLAGIEVILRLRDQMETTRGQLDRLATALRQAIEDVGEPDGRD